MTGEPNVTGNAGGEGDAFADPEPSAQPITALTPPATIGIIGAGYLGIEAALYARFLGYRVVVWEQAADIAPLGSSQDAPDADRAFTLGECTTSLGRNALAAQSGTDVFSDKSVALSEGSWTADYLRPLAQTDLIRGCIHTNVRIDSVIPLPPNASPQTDRDAEVGAEAEDSAENGFVVTGTESDRTERVAVVIDTRSAEPMLGPSCIDGERIASSGRPIPAAFLLRSVANYYVIGPCTWGKRCAAFSPADGHDQIRALFSIIGNRDALCLYESA